VRHPSWIRIRPTSVSGRQSPGPGGQLVHSQHPRYGRLIPGTPVTLVTRNPRASDRPTDGRCRQLVYDYARFAGPARTIPAVMTDACGPKSPDSHRVVWGLTSRPPVPLRAFLRFPVCPPGSSHSPAFPWFPVVRRSPVRLLRPLPGFRFPFGFPPGSLRRATLTLALPRGDSAGVGPGRQGPRSPVPPRPLAWIARSARTTDMSSIRTESCAAACRCRVDHRVH
jgi:hypothetical protein